MFIFMKLFLFLILIFQNIGANDEWPTLKGPYLGQKPPGIQRAIFAPGIISTGFNEHGVSFTPDGREVFYRLLGPPHGIVLTLRE
ncbi:MAG: hypothetical protein KAS65_09910, partial [Candidatus Aminicenantes bacterium]|nr:hypothetical protein [Candidatus Aminicenantes bacterium]